MSFNWLNSLFTSEGKKIRRGGSSRKPSLFRPRVNELEDRRVLASLYVDDVFSGTSPNLVWNAGRADAVSGLTLGTNAFTTISAAYTAASNGDTIFIGTGTFTLPANFTISKSLSFKGSGVSDTNKNDLTPASLINPSSDSTNSSGSGAGWMTINSGSAVNFDRLIIDGLSGTDQNSRKIAQAVRYESTSISTVNNVLFRNIGGDFTGFPTGNKYIGTAVVDLAGQVNVTNSTFLNITREGVIYSGATATGTVLGMTYTGKGTGDFLDYGVEANAGANVTVTASFITGNLGIATLDNTDSAALFASDPNTVLKAYGNRIENNQIGVIAGVGTDTTADTTSLDVEYNNIIGNVIGIQTNLATAGTFTNNWWGVRSAPPSSGANFVDDGGAASNTSSFLYKKTWQWNGTSAANYLANTSFFAVTNELGDASTIARLVVYDNTSGTASKLGVTVNNPIISIFPFVDGNGSGYKGGLTADIGDYDGDYKPDVVVGVRSGNSSTNAAVRVFDVATGTLKADFFAFDNGFNGGANVRFADLNGDGFDEIVTAKGKDLGAASGAAIRVWGNATPGSLAPAKITEILQAQVFPGFTGSIAVGSGDYNGDGKSEISVTPESTNIAAGKPLPARLDHIEIFSYTGGTGGSAVGTIPTDGSATRTQSYLLFDQFPNITKVKPNGMGLFTDGADLNRDGFDELLISTDSVLKTSDSTNGNPDPARVLSISYATSSTGTLTNNFYAYQAGYTGGARIAGARVLGTGNPQILVGTGPNRVPTGNGDVRVFQNAPTIGAGGFAQPNLTDFNVFGSLLAGVNVGG